ncbi:MAG: mechanosensitive ion channel [Syntrophotaleaceae bacterium]
MQIPLTAFAFLGGALAIGVGFGGQNLINNFMSSLILLIEKPIKVGDIVEAEGVLGRVTAIGGRCSTIRRLDGVDLLVPNSHLLEKTVVNRTLSDNLVRYEIQVGVAYGSPTRDVFHILEQVVDEHGQILKDPKPLVLLEDFSDNALRFGIYYWIEIHERLDVRSIASNLRHRIDRLFRDAGISIAFPQRDVHLDTVNPLKIQMVADSQPKGESTKGGAAPPNHEKSNLPG